MTFGLEISPKFRLFNEELAQTEDEAGNTPDMKLICALAAGICAGAPEKPETIKTKVFSLLVITLTYGDQRHSMVLSFRDPPKLKKCQVRPIHNLHSQSVLQKPIWCHLRYRLRARKFFLCNAYLWLHLRFEPFLH